ncbi:MAG: hypothetical protein K6T29_05305 [Peptococcaceae bacterium]|nr:hypothetical protein [Peptococcaceae bacterium]
MKIAGSAVVMYGEGTTVKSHTKEEFLRVWAGSRGPGPGPGDALAGELPGIQLDIVELSDQARAALARERAPAEAGRADKVTVFEISEEDKQKILLIQKMIEALTGKKVKFYVLGKIEMEGGRGGSAGRPDKQAAQHARRFGWGLEYVYRESYYEQEKMSFSARGTIKTADGRAIAFSVQLNMSREFYARQEFLFRAGDAALADPLVINFGGTAPRLTGDKFYFDLDCDGREDQLSFVGPGSGFLAVDFNGDDRINDGRELFGPATGNGFAELAVFDEDGNQWIDENDAIYNRLRIWTKDAAGRDVLFALGQKGVGAIYLGNLDTLFSIKDGENNLQGRVRRTGIYVGENGAGGTVQQVDLKI